MLAQLEGLNPLNPTVPINKGSGMVFQDVMLIILTGLALGLVLLLFAKIYVRRSRAGRHGRRAESPPQPVTYDEDEEEHHHHGRRRRRRRRHRRDHRLRNPTLAETGGLPPPKPPEPSNPPL
jgi:hypothetical protein